MFIAVDVSFDGADSKACCPELSADIDVNTCVLNVLMVSFRDKS